MRDALDEQIEAYEALLPSIRMKHGSVWVLIADGQLIQTFGAFSAAAKYARDHYGRTQVLIRHTDERTLESAPFVQVRVEE
jgi:hypothetical protein